MATLTVKLTATGGGNTASNPANALDDDGLDADIGYLEDLQRTTGNHDGSNLGFITKVELGAETTGSSGSNDWRGGYGSDEDTGTFTLGGTEYFDITAVRNWLWSDFDTDSNLLGEISNGQVSATLCDYLFFRVTYIAGVDGIMEINRFNRAFGSEFV